jgi:hypothetical protein
MTDHRHFGAVIDLRRDDALGDAVEREDPKGDGDEQDASCSY